jgi:hypothetical protein
VGTLVRLRNVSAFDPGLLIDWQTRGTDAHLSVEVPLSIPRRDETPREGRATLGPVRTNARALPRTKGLGSSHEEI